MANMGVQYLTLVFLKVMHNLVIGHYLQLKTDDRMLVLMDFVIKLFLEVNK